MITAEKAIEALENKIEALSKVSNSKEFNNWQKATSTTLSNIYPNNESVIKKFEGIKSSFSGLNATIDKTIDAKQTAETMLKSIVSDIKHFDLPHLKEAKQIEKLSVNVLQQNHQNQSTSISIKIDFIIDVLKGELRSSEIEEVKDILKSDDEPKEKKKKFMDKIKSFGSDVASNILANILTNPQVYEQIGKML